MKFKFTKKCVLTIGSTAVAICVASGFASGFASSSATISAGDLASDLSSYMKATPYTSVVNGICCKTEDGKHGTLSIGHGHTSCNTQVACS